MDAQTFLKNVRTKYPQYNDMSDTDLYSAIVKKHPEYSDIKYDSTPKAESLLQKIGSVANNALNASIPPLAAYNHPESLNMAGQILGGMVGGYPGSVAGETVGDIAGQGVNQLKGKGNIDFGKVGLNTAITGATEGLGRGLGKLFTGGAASREVVKTGMGKLSEMKDALRTAGDQDPSLWVEKTPILNKITELYQNSVNPKGPAKAIFSDWIDKLSNPEVTHISPRALIQMEEQFGQASKYFPEGSNFLTKMLYGALNPIKDTVLNTGAKVARGMVSDAVDTTASKAGMSEFGDVSKSFSEAKGALSGNQPSGLEKFLGGLGKAGEVGSAAGIGQVLGGHPVIGGLVGIADLIRKSPMAQDFVYNTLGKTGVGQGATVGISDLMRRISGGS